MHHQPVRSQRQPPIFLARLGTRRLCKPTGGHSVLLKVFKSPTSSCTPRQCAQPRRSWVPSCRGESQCSRQRRRQSWEESQWWWQLQPPILKMFFSKNKSLCALQFMSLGQNVSVRCGNCLHHISEAEPVKVYHQNWILSAFESI